MSQLIQQLVLDVVALVFNLTGISHNLSGGASDQQKQ